MKLNGNNISSVRFSNTQAGALTEYPVIDFYDAATGEKEARWVYNYDYDYREALLPASTSSIDCSRIASQYQLASTGAINNGDTIYFKDELQFTVNLNEGYEIDSNVFNLYVGKSGTDIFLDIIQRINAAVIGVTYYIGTFPQVHGLDCVESLVCYRDQSPLQHAPLGVINNGDRLYYGDKLHWVAIPKTGYEFTTLNYTETASYEVGDNDVTGVTATGMELRVLQFTYTQGELPKINNLTCIETFKCYRDASPLESASIGEINNGATIYYGDKLHWTATVTTPYNTPVLINNGIDYSQTNAHSVVDDVNGVLLTNVRTTVKSYICTLTKNSNVSTIKMWRTESVYQGAEASTEGSPMISGTGTATIYYGDKLSGTVSPDTYWSIVGSSTYSNTGVDDDVSWAPTTFPQSYTYSTGSLPSGVSSLTCYRSSSPYASAGAGKISNGGTIYYGDTLYWTATLETGYRYVTNNAYYDGSHTYIVSGNVIGITTTGITVSNLYYFTLTNNLSVQARASLDGGTYVYIASGSSYTFEVVYNTYYNSIAVNADGYQGAEWTIGYITKDDSRTISSHTVRVTDKCDWYVDAPRYSQQSFTCNVSTYGSAFNPPITQDMINNYETWAGVPYTAESCLTYNETATSCTVKIIGAREDGQAIIRYYYYTGYTYEQIDLS